MTFAFIEANRGEWPVSWMCAALEVSESGYHAWAVRPPSEVQRRHAVWVAVIAAVHPEAGTRPRREVHDPGQAKASIFAFIETFYNRVRRHSSLGFVSPVEFERAHNQKHP